MIILGIDYGTARTGISISDPTGFIAGSPSVIHEYNRDKLVEKLCEVVETRKVQEIVLGYPKNMNDTLGERAEKSMELKKILEEKTGLIVALWDERRTTVDAHRILSETGKRGQKRKNTVDAVAATLILQGYLDFKRMQPK